MIAICGVHIVESLFMGRNFVSDNCKFKKPKNLFKKKLCKKPRFLPAVVYTVTCEVVSN